MVDRRVLESDAEWVRKLFGTAVGILSFILCLVILFTRMDGQPAGWGAVRALLAALFAWYVMTHVGTAIGRWVGHLMVGVAEVKRRQEYEEIERQLKAKKAEKESEDTEETRMVLTPELLRVGMKTEEAVIGDDGIQIVPSGVALTQSHIDAILESGVNQVPILTAAPRSALE